MHWHATGNDCEKLIKKNVTRVDFGLTLGWLRCWLWVDSKVLSVTKYFKTQKTCIIHNATEKKYFLRSTFLIQKYSKTRNSICCHNNPVILLWYFVTIKKYFVGLTLFIFFEGEGEENFILQKKMKNTEKHFSKIVYTFEKIKKTNILFYHFLSNHHPPAKCPATN